MSDSLRLFFAVNFSDEIRQKISNELVSLIPRNGFGITRSQNLHMTLAFLGYHPVAQAKQFAQKAMAVADFGSFDAELKGIGHFKNRVLWLGTGKGTQECNELARALLKALEFHTLSFHAHVTLARNKGASKKTMEETRHQLHSKNFCENVQVRGFDLMASQLRTSGPMYTKIASVLFT